MDLDYYVNELRTQLLVAADAGGDEARLLAERLVAPLQSATRLVLLDALSAAAGEITTDLAPGSVEVRLRGGDPDFVVIPPGVDPSGVPEPTGLDVMATASGDRGGDVDEGATSRVTLRLPEQLKLRIEEAATRESLSVNSWLVRTLGNLVEPTEQNAAGATRNRHGGQRFTGWARS